MSRKLADIEANAPEDYFTTVSSEGLDEDTWRVVFFWPKDFTFVCPTEIAAFGKLADEFEARDTQVIGVSVDNEYTHYAWRRSHEELVDPPIVMASDLKRELVSAPGHPEQGRRCRPRNLHHRSPQHHPVGLHYR